MTILKYARNVILFKKVIAVAIIFCMVNHACYATIESAKTLKLQADMSDYDFSTNVNIEKLLRKNLQGVNDIIYTIIPMGVVVSFDSFLFFDNGSDEIRTNSYCILEIIANLLVLLNKPCLVESTTSANSYYNSKYNSNWELSVVRAGNLQKYLLSTKKILPDKFRANGFGEIMPVVRYQGKTQERINFIIFNYEDSFRR